MHLHNNQECCRNAGHQSLGSLYPTVSDGLWSSGQVKDGLHGIFIHSKESS